MGSDRDDSLCFDTDFSRAVAPRYRERWRHSLVSTLFLILSYFPFNVFGVVALIWIGTVILCLIGHSEAIVTTAIPSAVVFVVAGISPGGAWVQPILRLADTAVGIVVGLLASGFELPFPVGKENGTDLSDLR